MLLGSFLYFHSFYSLSASELYTCIFMCITSVYMYLLLLLSMYVEHGIMLHWKERLPSVSE